MKPYYILLKDLMKITNNMIRDLQEYKEELQQEYDEYNKMEEDRIKKLEETRKLIWCDSYRTPSEE